MHKLGRCVRFSINPFLPKDSVGFNPFASKPGGEGLSIFFELCVEISGEVKPATGFVVNVVDIDRCVREVVVPIFAVRVRSNFRHGRGIGFFGIAELLRTAHGQLSNRFGGSIPGELSLKLSPFKRVAMDSGDCEMVYFGEKFEFAATHKLWNEDFSERRNFAVFGKCANPAGHGHNYVVEVTVKIPADREAFCIGDFERIVDEEFIRAVDHKNLNADVPYFAGVIPTVENIATFAWQRIAGKFGEATLHCVTVWETDKTYCSYYGS